MYVAAVFATGGGLLDYLYAIDPGILYLTTIVSVVFAVYFWAKSRPLQGHLSQVTADMERFRLENSKLKKGINSALREYDQSGPSLSK
jgi:hypothetical protein